MSPPTLTLRWLAGCLAGALSWASPNAAGAGDWISLFDGQTLRGWKASEHAASFKVVDGQIAADGPRAHLFYVGPDGQATFKDFELEAEVLTQPGANSGLYFHTQFQDTDWPAQGFEVQINNTHRGEGSYRELKKTGSLYGIRNVYKALARDQEWFTLRVLVQGQRVQVRVNQTLVVDYVEPVPAVAPKESPGRVLSAGTFALQCHDPASQARFRNLRVRRLPEGGVLEGGAAPKVDDRYRLILDLSSENFPVINFHVHLKGGLTLEQALALSRQTGIGYGVAVNCGVGFGVTNDAGIHDYLRTMQGQPVFVGMQAEGREWVHLFSPAAVAQFDYVFTDAMTFTDDRGKRTRLWIRDEVSVPDPQAFMEMLVNRIVTILDREPIDIYVNPTFLPDCIARDYDALWTPERMDRVVAAVAKSGVALEINARLRLPSLAFLKRAKAAGVKFTFGTNNGDRNVGDLDYALQMVEALGLTWQDMFMPKPDGQKPVQRRGLR